MKQVIYIDVLIFLNIIITFLLLLATSRLLKLSPSPGRIVLGSVLGGVFSLVILAPDFSFVLSIPVKLLFSLIIVTSVYNPKSFSAIAKVTGYFFAVNFIFAGIMLFVSSLPGISIVNYKNGAVYINFSFFSLIAASVICYTVTSILGKVTKHKPAGEILFEIEIEHEGKKVKTTALLDTGNSLSDPFTGESVMVGDRFILKPILPENILLYYSARDTVSGIKLIPCKTVSSQTLLPCFRADSIKIHSENSQCVLKNAEIAVSENRLENIILPVMLYEISERRRYNVKV